MKYEAVIFSDVHARENDDEGLARLDRFLGEVAPDARRLYILGDFFDFWFGPKQARKNPYSDILARLGELSRSGVEVTFFHGNRDFYIDASFAARWGIRVVEDYSIEVIGGRRVYMAHGDMLCTNDRGYHRMRALVRNPVMKFILSHMPAAWAEGMARAYRAKSKRTVAAKTQWVLGIDDEAVKAAFRLGADAVVIGHTHRRGERVFDLGEGRRILYTLGDFGKEGSYLVAGPDGLQFHNI